MGKASEKWNNMEDKTKSRIIWGVVIVALVLVFVVLAISKYADEQSDFFAVGDYKISKREYNLYYNDEYSAFVAQNGSYLSYFLDTSQPLSSQTYSGELTWDDYFMEIAVTDIQNVYALYDAAKKDSNFDANVDDLLKERIDTLKESLAGTEYSLKEYLKQMYGNSMTVAAYREYIERQLIAVQYDEYLREQKEPTDEELEAEYEENKANYSMATFRAVTESYSYDSDATDEEIEAAKNEAKEKAEAHLENMEEADLTEDYMVVNLREVLRNWLLEDHQEGDTAVLEDESYNSYYAVEFVSLERNTYGTVSYRLIAFSAADNSEKVAKDKAEMTYEFWQNSDTGEDGFAELANETSDDTSRTGGLYSDSYYGYTRTEINDWLYETGRKEGDSTIISTEDGSYIVYLVSKDDEAYWKSTAKEAIKAAYASEKETELIEAMEITDPDKNLTYLTRKSASELQTNKATETDAK